MLILLNDPQIAAVKVKDNGEKMISLRNRHPKILIDESRRQIANDSEKFCYVRESVAQRLLQAAEKLKDSYEIVIKEAYRPLQRQQKTFDEAYEFYRRNNPDASEEKLYILTCQYVAPVCVAGHPTGGAIDLTLRYQGEEVDMGTDFNAEPVAPENLTYLEAPGISAQAKDNRKRLIELMTEIDFTNYPTEWWHWSYGDPYWAYFHQCEAFYEGIDEGDCFFS